MIIRMRVAAAAIAGAAMMVSGGTAALAVPAAPKAGVLAGARSGSGLAAGAGGSLLDVAASSARNAWLVEQLPSYSLRLLHWNSTAWSQTAIPSPSVNSVTAVAAVSAGNAWAVGQHCADQCATIDTLILHWDGRAWRRVASPSPAGRADFLKDVSASSARNAWAAGESCALATQACVPLMLHWNGSAWARVPSPAIGASAEPLAVTVASAASA